jgi:hypothetical protein
MSSARESSIGKTQVCPHCKTTILDSATICPACKHYLRYDASVASNAVRRESVFNVEAGFRQPATAETVEYSVLIVVRNERDEEIARRVVDVGAIAPGELRRFSVSVDVSSGPVRPRPLR